MCLPACRSTVLLARYLRPVAAVAFPDCGGRTVDHHHSFLVHYTVDKDRRLDMHTDDSDVTFNVNICDAFEGAGLSFCGMSTACDHRQHRLSYHHVLGRAVMHPGRLRHGADSLVAGERVNLIVWCRSSSVRLGSDHQPPRVDADVVPDPVCLSRSHDPDYDHWVTPSQTPALGVEVGGAGGTGGAGGVSCSHHAHDHCSCGDH